MGHGPLSNARWRGRNLKDRPLGKLKMADITREELDTALTLLRKVYRRNPLMDANGRPAASRAEWQRECLARGLDEPGKLRELLLGLKKRGSVEFGSGGIVYAGCLSQEPIE